MKSKLKRGITYGGHQEHKYWLSWCKISPPQASIVKIDPIHNRGEKGIEYLTMGYEWLCYKLQMEMIHYLKNKVGVVDFANAQGLVMF